MLGSERGVVEEWLSEFKVNWIGDKYGSDAYIYIYQYSNIEYVFYGETEMLWSGNGKIQKNLFLMK